MLSLHLADSVLIIMSDSIRSRELVQPDRTVRLSVVSTPNGWEVREECGDTVVRVSRYSDWHRVERSIERAQRREMAVTP